MCGIEVGYSVIQDLIDVSIPYVGAGGVRHCKRDCQFIGDDGLSQSPTWGRGVCGKWGRCKAWSVTAMSQSPTWGRGVCGAFITVRTGSAPSRSSQSPTWGRGVCGRASARSSPMWSLCVSIPYVGAGGVRPFGALHWSQWTSRACLNPLRGGGGCAAAWPSNSVLGGVFLSQSPTWGRGVCGSAPKNLNDLPALSRVFCTPPILPDPLSTDCSWSTSTPNKEALEIKGKFVRCTPPRSGSRSGGVHAPNQAGACGATGRCRQVRWRGRFSRNRR